MEEVGTMSSIIHNFDNSTLLVQDLASKIIEDLEKSIKEKGSASLLVSGGNTPKKLFEELSNKDFSWQFVTVALVDERLVETTHCQSNENLVTNHLLQNFASKSKFIGLYIPNKNIDELEDFCSKKYEEIYPFDVVVLGMGNDAHTASLFPNNEKLKEALDLDSSKLCISIEPDTAPYTRMSLNLKAIINSKKIYLHIEGNEKFEVLQDALTSSNSFKTPITAVLNSNNIVEVFYS